MNSLSSDSADTHETSPIQCITVCITRTDQESYLCSEIQESVRRDLRLPSVECTHITSQTVVVRHCSHENLCSLPLFFAARCLPESQEISASSVSTLATRILNCLIESFGDSPPPWCLHVFEPLSVETGKQYARPSRLRETILALLKQKRRSYLKALKQTATAQETLVQIVLVDPNRGYISIADTHLQKLYKSAITPAWAGYHIIADDHRPPSRAFKKLREAIEIFSLSLHRGDSAVDLGASPGGWTYVLRQEGLSVTAIDRSPLTPTLMRDARVSWVCANALTWIPSRPVTWLVCDVITSPENTARIIHNWIEKRLCTYFCVTVKFKGPPAIDSLLSLGTFLRDNTHWFESRQLTHNKNELTVVGSIRSK